MPEPEKVDASSQPLATGTQQQLYKRLLNEQCQKIWKQLPVYQTNNEGSEHQPKFRTTVWIDGLSYTSPSTFQHRKMAESDASKITLFAIMQKLKNETSRLVREDKFYCKSILVEFAVKMNLERPTYETTTLGPPCFLFRSSLVFNNVTYTGDDCRTKKEAEQSAACAVILKYLDSDTGNILVEIIKCKFNHYTVSKDTQNVQNDTNRLTMHTDTRPMNPPVPVTQTNTLQISTQALPQTTQAPTVLTQTPIVGTTSALTQQGTTITAMNTPVTHIPTISTQTPTQTIAMPAVSHIPAISSQAPAQTIAVPTVLAQTQFVGTNNAPTPSTPSVGHTVTTPTTHVSSNVVGLIKTETPTTHISSNVVGPVKSETPSMTTTHLSSNVVEPEKLEVPAVTETPAVTVTPPTSGKKRNRRSRKNAQKRMRAENQLGMSAMLHGQVPAFSAQ